MATEREAIYRREFLLRHQDSDVLVFDEVTKQPLEARYFTFWHHQREEWQAFGRMLQAIMDAEGWDEDDEN